MLRDELMEAIVQLMVLLGKLAELLVALQQEILHFLRFCCVHTPPSFYSKGRLVGAYSQSITVAPKRSTGHAQSAAAVGGWGGLIAPQDQRIFNWIRVVVASRACDVEPQSLVQSTCTGVAGAH